MLTEPTKDFLSFDLDENGAPLFTQNNIKLINTFLKYDSKYSSAENESNINYNSSYAGILKSLKSDFFNFKRYEDYINEKDYVENDVLYKVIESIDKINSTHLASEGRKGGNKGRIKTAIGISKIINLKKLLNSGDANLVQTIATFATTNKISFASKFCHYVCRFALDNENLYCVYDSVVQSILPYYLYKYNVHEFKQTYITKRTKNNVSTLDDNKDNNTYAKYRNYIDKLIINLKKETNIKITYSVLDHLLWYFFKGSPALVQSLMKLLPENKNK